jgi:4-hydroxybenzoyl-CoA thioesterase
MSKVFSVEYPILFSHCDPAGIVYFPRFFDLLHRAMEDWFTFGLEERFADFIMKKKLGIPTVGTKVDFVGPARFGDLLQVELRVAKLGSSSIELAIDSFVGERPCFRARHTVCVFSQETYRAVPIPDDLRARMEPYVVRG